MSSRSNETSADDPLVGVDLDDAEHLRDERLGSLDRGPRSVTREDKALPAGRNDGRRHVRDPEVGDRPHVRDLGVSTMSDSGAHHPTAIVAGKVVGQDLGHGVPVACREVRQEVLVHLACRVFQPRCRPAELLEPRERGVEVCLVEYFAAVDQVAFDRQKFDHPPLGVEALLRGPMRRMGDDRSEVVQPMHGLDVDAACLA